MPYTVKMHKEIDDKIRASLALERWKRMKEWSDLDLLNITKEDPDFVNVETWDNDIYDLIGRGEAFGNYDKTVIRAKIPVDRAEELKSKWLKKIDRQANKIQIQYGNEVKGSVLSDSVKYYNCLTIIELLMMIK